MVRFNETYPILYTVRKDLSVNVELINCIGLSEYVSKKIALAEWGKSVVDNLADYIQTLHPEFKGFTCGGLYRHCYQVNFQFFLT